MILGYVTTQRSCIFEKSDKMSKDLEAVMFRFKVGLVTRYSRGET